MSNIAWPVMGVTVFMTAISWSMQRGSSRRREWSTRARNVEQQPAGLHCPHCGHALADADFAGHRPPAAPRDISQACATTANHECSPVQPGPCGPDAGG